VGPRTRRDDIIKSVVFPLLTSSPTRCMTQVSQCPCRSQNGHFQHGLWVSHYRSRLNIYLTYPYLTPGPSYVEVFQSQGRNSVQASPPKFHPRKTVEKSLLCNYRHQASTKSRVSHTQLLRRTFMKRRMQPGVPK